MPTIQTPNTAKVRCESSRRFWIIHQWTVRETGAPAAAVALRTDNIATARKFAARQSGRGHLRLSPESLLLADASKHGRAIMTSPDTVPDAAFGWALTWVMLVVVVMFTCSVALRLLLWLIAKLPTSRPVSLPKPADRHETKPTQPLLVAITKADPADKEWLTQQAQLAGLIKETGDKP